MAPQPFEKGLFLIERKGLFFSSLSFNKLKWLSTFQKELISLPLFWGRRRVSKELVKKIYADKILQTSLTVDDIAKRLSLGTCHGDCLAIIHLCLSKEKKTSIAIEEIIYFQMLEILRGNQTLETIEDLPKPKQKTFFRKKFPIINNQDLMLIRLWQEGKKTGHSLILCQKEDNSWFYTSGLGFFYYKNSQKLQDSLKRYLECFFPKANNFCIETY